MKIPLQRWVQLFTVTALGVSLHAADPATPPQRGPGEAGGPPPFGGPGGGPPFGGPGMGGPGMGGQETKILEKFDKNGNKVLDAEERKAAREFLAKEVAEGRGPRGMGRRGGPGRGGDQEPRQPGKKLTPADVKNYPDVGLYDTSVVKTFFIEFEETDWEKQLSDFHNTDVEVPAKLTVDGKVYKDVGVHFRGMSSYGMVPAGQKRPLNVALDFVHKDQNLGGHRTVNLLNAHDDPSFLRPVLFYDIARQYVPAPKAGFVRVVINGENWGIYNSVEQFNKDFTKTWFGSTKGARWKVRGSPNGQGRLSYLGDDPAKYKGIYTIKTKDDPKAWTSFISMLKLLNETPAAELETKLPKVLNVDGALRFLALDNALINNDGYWIRTSDYSIYQDEKGVFHVLPQDANETFVRPGGPGFGGRGGRGPGGPGGGGGAPGGGPAPAATKGVELDPLLMAENENKPLISKLLAVPAWRTKYLGYIKDIAEKRLDWTTLGPVVQRYHDLIAEDVKIDTRKLDSTEDFEKSITQDTAGRGFGPGGGGTIALKNFADQRRAYLLEYPAIKNLGR